MILIAAPKQGDPKRCVREVVQRKSQARLGVP
jgi:hypothetical protein